MTNCMNTHNANVNIAVVRRLYEARGDTEIIRQVLASDVRWEVIEGFPYSDVYLGLNGVSDCFTRLYSAFEDWHTEPSACFETGGHVIAIWHLFGKGESHRQNLQGAFRARMDNARRCDRAPSASR